MGCGPSKKDAVSDPVLVGGDEPADKPLEKPVEPEQVVLAPAPEPDPDPPPAPVACGTYKVDDAAAPCLECPPGWLSRTATEGKKAGCVYYFSSEDGVSQWQCPAGAAKTAPEPTCTCGRLKSAHTVCETWEPQVGTEPPTCRCGFLKDDHKACNDYRVNMAGANFGDCKCGFAKDAHDASAFATGAKAKRAERTSSQLREDMQAKTYADCSKYTVNLESANFGECTCGRPKAEHSPEALAKNAAAGQAQGAIRRDSESMRSKFTQKTKVECVKYEPDLTAGEFGLCKCGAKRVDHSEAALTADTGSKAARQQDEAEVRAKFEKKALADCARFELNMDPSAPFGTCTCGRPRGEHSAAALQAADAAPRPLVKKASSELRRDMENKQDVAGTTVETTGGKTDVAFGLANTVRTAEQEQAAVQAAINARAGGADKAAALNEFNEMMKVAAPAAA